MRQLLSLFLLAAILGPPLGMALCEAQDSEPAWVCSMHDNAESCARACAARQGRSEEHTSELQSRGQLVCRLLLEKKNDGFPKPARRGQANRLIYRAGILHVQFV